jgi:hypothetical protein
MKSILTIADLNEARSQERSIIFLWVNWAIQARHSEAEVRKLLQTLEKDYPDCRTALYRVDVSDQEGPLWNAFMAWLRPEFQTRGNLLYGGYGALLWLRAGSINASVVGALGHSQEQLLAITRGLFNARA